MLIISSFNSKLMSWLTNIIMILGREKMDSCEGGIPYIGCMFFLPHIEVDPTCEVYLQWETRNIHLMHDIFSCLCWWVQCRTNPHLSAKQANINEKNINIFQLEKSIFGFLYNKLLGTLKIKKNKKIVHNYCHKSLRS